MGKFECVIVSCSNLQWQTDGEDNLMSRPGQTGTNATPKGCKTWLAWAREPNQELLAPPLAALPRARSVGPLTISSISVILMIALLLFFIQARTTDATFPLRLEEITRFSVARYRAVS